ncbi:PGG domain [Macleaya cordata]|uniref:PGG domain n=1 Tax=Macleaya cordata TaxID=56857 RepID=A0A200Q4D0_MACCD|nr:PGG domain [Macleaya cordata]
MAGMKPNDYAKYAKETLDLIERVNANHMVVAALVATVTFAAGFTLPGGYNSDGPNKGMAVLKVKPAFMVFIVFDTIAMLLSTFALFIIFWSNFIRNDRQAKLETLTLVTLFCTISAIVAMVIAFVTGTYVVLSDSPGLAIPLCILGCSFFPLCVFLVRTIFKWESARK